MIAVFEFLCFPALSRTDVDIHVFERFASASTVPVSNRSCPAGSLQFMPGPSNGNPVFHVFTRVDSSGFVSCLNYRVKYTNSIYLCPKNMCFHFSILRYML